MKWIAIYEGKFASLHNRHRWMKNTHQCPILIHPWLNRKVNTIKCTPFKYHIYTSLAHTSTIQYLVFVPNRSMNKLHFLWRTVHLLFPLLYIQWSNGCSTATIVSYVCIVFILGGGYWQYNNSCCWKPRIQNAWSMVLFVKLTTAISSPRVGNSAEHSIPALCINTKGWRSHSCCGRPHYEA